MDGWSARNRRTDEFVNPVFDGCAQRHSRMSSVDEPQAATLRTRAAEEARDEGWDVVAVDSRGAVGVGVSIYVGGMGIAQ
jgi:hypothetical protein